MTDSRVLPPPDALPALPGPAEAGCLVDVIDLKWLLAGQGHRLHVERMLSDRAYALHCLALAAGSPQEAARVLGARLAAGLGLPMPVACAQAVVGSIVNDQASS